MARRATLKDVAERAQVSTATVSYVLNDKKSISEQTKTRVYDAIRDLNYVPDLSARFKADWNCHSTDRARQQTDAAK